MSKEQLPGVYPAQKKNGTVYYRSSITYRGRHISLGSYPTADDAHLAYRDADHLLHCASLTLEDYAAAQRLTFEKWVILHNFRDNGIYLSTPIYIKKGYLLYYLSSELILKFDMDDLFYYAKHKIMKRGGHLFVADYGMQVNILNRYGIKNYGVEGRDYRFVNGDSTDFRYENIEIFNSYHGVQPVDTGTQTLYKAFIHLKGNYMIGTYETAEEAAIAYNKAIDILKKNGVSKNFTPNYLENVSASEYAEIYVRLSLSERILRYTPD
ncbi:MAG: hypothetical protein J6B10_00155 [Lachnospiraceae bacterium]|nr:hypothetical protein [Lachnospiraceae bacterium]